MPNMTSKKQFHDNVLETLKFLEQTLPPESHVILVGLIDGSVLYKAMAKRYHPLGMLRKDLTYDDVYDWFNCMEIGPCHGINILFVKIAMFVFQIHTTFIFLGWMTRNKTLREITSRQ